MIFTPILNALRSFAIAVSRPPYTGLPWLVLGYVVLCCLIYTDNGPLTGHVVGFDDQTRMTQVLQFVNGQGWYDHTIMRANPPEGFTTIWTRIVDLPLALIILAAQQVVDQRTAALVAVTVMPLVELWILFVVGRYFARPLVGKKDAWLIVLFLMFTTALNKKNFTLAGFHPGEASHHSWYIILNLLMFAASARLALNVRGRSPYILLALAIGCMLAIGIEGFPMIAGNTMIFAALAWCLNDAKLARRGAVGMGLAALLTLALLPLHVPPSHFFEASFSQPSIVGPYIVTAAALFLAWQSFVLGFFPRSKAASVIPLVLCAALLGAGLVYLFPQILDGPGAALTPEERHMAFNNHPEVWRMWRVATDTIDYIGLSVPLFIGWAAGIYALCKAGTRRRRILYASYLGFAVVGGVMAQIFWRYFHHAIASACVWLLWIWQKLLIKLPRDRDYSLKALGSFVMLCPFWMLILPALDTDAPFLTQVMFYPAKVYATPFTCDALDFSDYLNSHYDARTNLVVPDWDSSQFVYYTNLTIDFLSNYPSHNHFIDNMAFFQSQDMDVSRDIAWRHHIDLVSLCRSLPIGGEMAASRPYRQPMLMERLREGNPPPWLHPLPVPATTPYMLFAVDKAEIEKGPHP